MAFPRMSTIVTEVLLSSKFLIVLFFSLITGFISGLVFFHVLDSRVFDERGRLIPGPQHHLWGKTYLSIARLIYYTHQYSKIIYEKFIKEVGNGDIAAFNWITGKPSIFVSHPDMAKTVLSGHHLKFIRDDSWDRVKYLLGTGLGTCEEKHWQKYRNFLTPLFRSSNLRDMVTTFNIHSRRLFRHWQFRLHQQLQEKGVQINNHSNHHYHPDSLWIKSPIDKEFRHLMLGIICECGFGYDFYTRENSEVFAQDFEIILNEFSFQRSIDPLERMWKNQYFTFTGKSPQDESIVQKALSNVQQLLEKTIQHRLDGTAFEENDYHLHPTPEKDSHLPLLNGKLHANGQNSSINSTYNPTTVSNTPPTKVPPMLPPPLELPSTNDLLQLLLDANEDSIDSQRLSLTEIRDHILSFMILGYETTVSALSWMIYELCLHPDIQKGCQAEVDQLLTVKGMKTSAVTYEDIPKFSKLIQCLKETLRLHPPCATITRRCITSCTIGDFSLKPGSRISINILALHRHPYYWYLPNDFFPDRFSQENIAETIKHPFQYVPFGAGGHNCIGQRFGQIAIVVILAILLSKFEFSIEQEDQDKIIMEEKACFGIQNLRVVIQERDANVSMNRESNSVAKK